jgi:ABC-type branched-subunit amino acid transport system substrate-binding protein
VTLKRWGAVLTACVLASALAAGAAVADTPGRGGGETIKIGGVGYGAFYGDSAAGVEARIARANRDEELPGGTQIEFVGFEEDDSDPTENSDATQRLIQQEDVFAIVPMMTPFPAGIELAEREGVPVFGWAIGPEWCDKEVAFGFSGGCLTPPEPEVYSNAWGVLLRDKFAGDIEGKTAAIIAEDNDLGRSGLITQEAAFEDVGLEVVYSEARMPAPPAAPPSDYTPFANELLESNDGDAPDVICLLLSSGNVLGMADKLRELEYAGVQTNAVQYDPRLIEGAEGSTVFIQMASFQAAPENEHVQQMIDDVEAEFGPDQLLVQPLASGYWAADFFIEVLKKAGRNPSQEEFLEVANDGFRYGVPDTVATTKWPKAHNQGSACGSLMEAQGEEYVVAVPFTCGKIKKLN